MGSVKNCDHAYQMYLFYLIQSTCNLDISEVLKGQHGAIMCLTFDFLITLRILFVINNCMVNY